MSAATQHVLIVGAYTAESKEVDQVHGRSTRRPSAVGSTKKRPAMFERFAKLFRRESAPLSEKSVRIDLSPSLHAPEAVSGDSAARRSLQSLMRTATSHLTASEGDRLSKAVLMDFDAAGDAPEAFAEGVLGEEGQRRGQWLALQCDWKAAEEIKWQVDEIASSFGITERWAWSDNEQGSKTVVDGLNEVARWAAPLGLNLLHIDLGGDDYCALMVKAADTGTARQAAVAAGFNALLTAEFLEANS